jgi:mono/diheme cytochrome c family protein
MARLMEARVASSAVSPLPPRAALLTLGALLCAAPLRAEEGDRLSFRRADGRETVLTKAELRARCHPETVTVDDAYYQEPRRYLACPLLRVLELGFGLPASELAERDFLLVALDGYARPAPGSQLTGGGGWLALEDADRVARGLSGFGLIDRRQVDAGPFYVVWTGPGRSDAHRYPWPYELTRIEVFRFEDRFPHTVPVGASEGSPARRGFAIFRRECISCHAVNGEGGRVGPELNVPKSIVEYRDPAWIEAYVRDPSAIRYTSMPPHPDLGDADLAALVSYFTWMSHQKHDPGPRRAE